MAALEARGCFVVRGQDVDLYVLTPPMTGLIATRNQLMGADKPYLVECKTPGPNEKRRQKIQKHLKAVFRGQYVIAKTPEEALEALHLLP